MVPVPADKWQNWMYKFHTTSRFKEKETTHESAA
jgi:hypothetical protein